MSGAHPQKRGLGRGLGALLGDDSVPTTPVANAAANAVREIPVGQIKPNPFQPRKRFDPQALADLQA
ncbi:MAG: ParB/RepB/Spo0J family partition protein, partial [Vulcanimicrobiaceae bacterium]